ncbi:manganese efflux pump MntP [Inquilinus sp. OTU3971]|uniref:manganese efflux pump MntP n=1 Tax=Inquilinus sp. OTU3971 TaxID=3043855 RepID=UPI00313D2137
MPLATTLGLAFSLSMDAFAAAIGKGVAARRIPVRAQAVEAVRVGVVLGGFELVMPLLGWALGIAFAESVAAVDHWVAFVLLGLVGGRMAWHGILPERVSAPDRRSSLGALAMAGIATSLDATAVGVSLAFVRIDIWTASLTIGAVTFAMCLLGFGLGRGAGAGLGRLAEVLGGLGLILVGARILVEHLGGA